MNTPSIKGFRTGFIVFSIFILAVFGRKKENKNWTLFSTSPCTLSYEEGGITWRLCALARFLVKLRVAVCFVTLVVKETSSG